MSEFGRQEEQRRVDARFNGETKFWCEIYEQNGLLAHILRERQSLALSFVDGLSLSLNSKVLDVGCGGGIMAVSLARRGFSVEAVDHAVGMVEQTRRLSKKMGLEHQICVGIEDAHKFSFKDDTFDLVVAIGVIHWLHDLRKALLDITRVLKPGGYAVFSVDTRWNSRFDIPQLLRTIAISQLRKVGLMDKVEIKNVGPKFYSAKLFNRYLLEVNLRRIKSRTMGFLPVTFFNHSITSEKTSLKIHSNLQKYTNGGFPVLNSLGAIYVVLTRKTEGATKA